MGHSSIEAPHKVIILRALQLGDMLCAVPAIRSLHAAFPEAHLTLVGLPWAADFVKRFSHYLHDFIAFPGWPGLPEREPQVRSIPGFLRSIQGQHYDLALQMHGSGLITNPLIELFGARHTAGFYLPGQYIPGDHFSVYPEGEHEVRTFLQLMESLGIPSQGEDLEFPVTDEEQASFERFRAANGLEEGSYICLHPGARFVGRRWTPEKFARVGDALVKMGYRIIVTGTTAERELTDAVVRAMHTPALDAAGQTDLGTLALLLSKARLLISNDTGVSHVAAAFHTPSVILFTVSDPNRWRPLNHHLHRVVSNAYEASPKDVLAVAEPLLRAERRHASAYVH